MAYIQKNVPPPNQSIPYSIIDFSGGLNNRSTILDKNEASDLLNMSFSDNTLMKRRNGTKYYDALALNSPIVFIDRYEPYDDRPFIIRATENAVYAENVKIADVSGAIHGKTYMGQYVFVDGYSIRKYGIFPQTSDTYTRIVGTPVNAYIVMKLVNPPDGYTPLGTEHTRGVWNYDYSKLELWYEPCENEMVDTYKGANVIPAEAKYIEVYGERLILAGDSSDDDNVFISDISNGLYFPVFLPIQMPPNSDKITGLVNFQDTLVVGRQRDLHVIYGNTNRSEMNTSLFRLKQINSHTGFANQKAINQAHNYLFFVGYDGNAYAMHTTETDVKLVATSILNRQIDITRSPIDATLEDARNSASVFYDDEWHIAIGDKTLIYSYRTRGWTMYKYHEFNATCFFNNDDYIMIGTNLGRIIQQDDDRFLDVEDMPYYSFWASRREDMDSPSIFKQFREFFIVANTFEGNASDISLRFEIDYVDVDESHTVSNQLSIFGKSVWGDRFINRNIVASLPIIIGRRGRTIRFIFSNGYFPSASVDELVELDGYLNLKEGTLVWVNSEESYYLYTDFAWYKKDIEDFNQAMLIQELNGEFELRGKR